MSTETQIEMICIKKVIWDNCMGNYVTAFDVGDVAIVSIHDGDPDTATATSPIYDDVDDFVPLTHFKKRD